MTDLATALGRGELVDLHIRLRQVEADAVRALAEEYRCSQSAVIGLFVRRQLARHAEMRGELLDAGPAEGRTKGYRRKKGTA